MEKKQIIQIVVIVIAFAAAGFVLYNGFFKGSGQAALELASQQPDTAATKGVLPYGSTLDFNVLKKQNLQYNQVIYPKLDPKSEIGIAEENLISLPPVTGQP